ncbi:MAG: amidohydrolase family protein [Dehalococcoidia bacterium]
MNKIWDVHCHLPLNWQNPAEDPAERLDEVAKALTAAGVVRACLLCADRFGMTHERAIAYARQYPELFVPVANVDPDRTDRRRVWELHQMGYRGLKLIAVRRDYDDRSYFPMYAAAEALDMPVLLHMGVIGGPVDYSRTHPRRDPEAARRAQMFARRPVRDHTAMRMHPFHLDTLANHFPDLKLIGAHLGGTGNYDAAASVARWRPNVFLDMSGGETIEEHGEKRGYIAQDIAVEKLVWGSDCRADEIDAHVQRFERMFERLGLTEDDAERMWWRNAAEIYGEATPRVAAE